MWIHIKDLIEQGQHLHHMARCNLPVPFGKVLAKFDAKWFLQIATRNQETIEEFVIVGRPKCCVPEKPESPHWLLCRVALANLTLQPGSCWTQKLRWLCFDCLLPRPALAAA